MLAAGLRELTAFDGRGALATWLHSSSALSAEMMARAGWDCLVVDLQHSVTGHAEAAILLQVMTNLGVTVLVRPPALDPALIGRILDAGASGVICPLINSPEQARTLVAACRYPPQGARSIGPIRARLLFGDDYVAKANDGVLVLAMIETAGGLEAVEEIARVPGLGGLFVGPNDLASSLGVLPRMDPVEPTVRAAMHRVAAAARATGIVAGIACETAAYARAMHADGFRLFVVGSDMRLMASGVRRLLEELRG